MFRALFEWKIHWGIPVCYRKLRLYPNIQSKEKRYLSFNQPSFSEIGSGTTKFSFTSFKINSAEIVLSSISSFESTTTLPHSQQGPVSSKRRKLIINLWFADDISLEWCGQILKPKKE